MHAKHTKLGKPHVNKTPLDKTISLQHYNMLVQINKYFMKISVIIFVTALEINRF